jgi:molybdopterin molybdotransferase
LLKPKAAATDTPCSIDEAQRRILALHPPVTGEMVSLCDAMGRYPAADMAAARSQPPFDAAAMDGWAVSGVAAGLYRIVGESRAGAGYGSGLAAGQAVAISTGAPMPAGAVRVVRREQATDRGRLIEVPVGGAMADVRPCGSDFLAGTPLARQGERIDHLAVARLAAGGLSAVRVAKRPIVAILATGDELVSPGKAPRADQIFDALSLPVGLRAQSTGAVIGGSQRIGDDPDLLAGVLDRLLPTDILVMIGGASGGRHDHARAALAARGYSMVVPAVLMKPGKPFWCAFGSDGSVVIGLPGNPVAALACVELLLVPLIRAWQGDTDPAPVIELPSATRSDPAVYEKVVFCRHEPIGSTVTVLGGADSAALSPVSGANGVLRTSAGFLMPLGS